ncbi:hypothetical protein [Methylocella sp.]|uniref:hypothetical protein n=1 Tax=Methylocella sp. TaxID=1978226 RepID=UPI0035B0DDF3
MPLKDGRVVDYNPALTKAKEIVAADKAGKLNELLEMGPVSKQEAAARVAQGETPVAVTERTPDGVEVKAAAGTEETAPAQVAALEEAKLPGSAVQVEDPRQVIQAREQGATSEESAPARVPRVLEDKSPEAQAAREQAKANIRAVVGGEEEAPVGKKRSEDERSARAGNNEKALAVVGEFPPGRGDATTIDGRAQGAAQARKDILARVKAMLARAKERGVEIPASIRDNTDAAMNHNEAAVLLAEARAIAGAWPAERRRASSAGSWRPLDVRGAGGGSAG